MIIKIPVYFILEAEEGVIDSDLVREQILNHLEEVLSESSDSLEIENGPRHDRNIVTANFVTISEVHEILRTKS